MYLETQKVPTDNRYVNYSVVYSHNLGVNINGTLADSLYINNLVICNTAAGDDIEADQYKEFTEYDYTFKQLKKNLEKEVNG